MKSFSQRLLITILSLWTSLTALQATNVVTVTGSDGKPGQESTIIVSLRTDDANVAAAEIRVPLPDGIEPEEGSLSMDGTRAPGHSVTADMNGREYVIVLFNTTLNPIPAGDGTLLTFKVTLGDNPGRFFLVPKVKLSGKGGDAIACEASGGSLNVLAPRLELGATAIDFGRVPIRNEVVRYVNVRNSGTTTLTFNGYNTGVEGLTAVMSQPLSEGESGTIELHYLPTIRKASIDGRFTPESDGVGRSQSIQIQAVPFSVNELHIGNTSGISDEEVTVSVSMNNMEPITGADFTIPLPDELEFVEGSVVKASRASDLNVESSVGTDHRLRIVLFGLSNKAMDGNDDEILSFQLKLKGSSGYYGLNPKRVRLANALGEDMTSQVYGGSVTISSPHLYSSSDWQIGNVPLSGTNSFGYCVSNYSNVPLTIEKVMFLDDVAECMTATPFIVEPNGQGEITISVKDPKFGKFATTMNVYSNDPDNRLKSVNVTGNFYSPNEMSFVGRSEGGKFLIDASLTNEKPIAALQLDIVCPDGITTEESLLQLADRAAGHSATLAKVDQNRYRIIIFSLKNTPFTGNDGLLFTLGIEGASAAGKQIRFENIKLSSIDGVNITTPDSDIKLGELPIPVSSVTLDSQDLKLRVGQTSTLIATVKPDNATDKSVKWISSNEDVATVSANGIVTAKELGETVITAICGEISAECTVIVEATPVESVTINQTTATLKATQTLQLTATVSPETATDKKVTWASSDEAIAKVNETGLVMAMKVGTATITATASSGVKAECIVTVAETPVESVILDRTTATLKAMQTLLLTATVAPGTATDKTVTWASSDESVAAVNESGLVTALKVGTAVITATASSGVKGECTVTVAETAVESVTINQTTVKLKATQTLQLTAIVAPETATDKTVTWTSSDKTVASVNESGLVTALKVGTTVITATASSGVSADCMVIVEATLVETVVLNHDDLELRLGDSYLLTATVLPEDATDKIITWTSSDIEVVTVDENGNVTAVGIKDGGATVTATAPNGVKASCHVTVIAPLATSIKVDKEAISAIVGDQIQLTATVLPIESSSQILEWESSNETVATVSSSGLVSIIAEGEATIIVSTTDGSNLSAKCMINSTSGIDLIYPDNTTSYHVYKVNGLLVKRNATRKDFNMLQSGLYIVNGKTIFKR